MSYLKRASAVRLVGQVVTKGTGKGVRMYDNWRVRNPTAKKEPAKKAPNHRKVKKRRAEAAVKNSPEVGVATAPPRGRTEEHSPGSRLSGSPANQRGKKKNNGKQPAEKVGVDADVAEGRHAGIKIGARPFTF